ncbi:hypothetical protein [Gordonia sp. NPDC003585]|uniref:hypothetical protein n=1 Tax=Gordonia sp. NPDC003585 TaxID=3154275 RepID=UPI0033A96C09
MANEAGANEAGPDPRPISVAELLARSQGTDGGETTSRRSRDRGRRRVGREGTVSVSELTGEIPKITDATPAPAPRTARTAPQTQPTQTQQTPAQQPAAQQTPSQPTPPAPAPTPSAQFTPPQTPSGRTAPRTGPFPTPDAGGTAPVSGPFPRSANPVARRGAPDRPVADQGWAPNTSPAGGRSASGMPGYRGTTPLSTRDFSSDAVARRLAESSATTDATASNQPASNQNDDAVDEVSANAVTGIIPVVGDEDSDLTVVDSDDVVAYDLSTTSGSADADARVRDDSKFGEVMDDFEAYRSFADVEDEPVEPKRKRGWFGRKRKSDKTPDVTDGRSSRRAAAGAAGVAAAAAGATAAVPALHDREDVNTEPDSATPDTDIDSPAAIDTATTDSPASFVDTAPVPEEREVEPAPEPTVEQPPTTDTGAWAQPAVDLSKSDAEPSDEFDKGEFDGDEFDRDEFEEVTPDRAPYVAPEAVDTAAEPIAETETLDDDLDRDETDLDEDTEPSPMKAWLMVIAQVVAGLAIGVGLFWGFTELWKWSVIFALVLAVLVIFGIVTFAHLLRRNRDLPTTLLALGVGLLVTIGPLVLLASR